LQVHYYIESQHFREIDTEDNKRHCDGHTVFRNLEISSDLALVSLVNAKYAPFSLSEFSSNFFMATKINVTVFCFEKSTTTLSLQNMFRSILDHLQLQVVHDEFEFHLELQCD